MSFKKILIATLLLILLPFTIKVQGGDFGQGNSLFSDIKAHKVGDILTVNIYENTQATNKAETKAEKTGQSPEFISQVENDEVVPAVSFLLRLARALDVDPGTFLREEEKTAILDQRAQAFVKRTKNYFYRTLTPGAENEHLRAFMVTIEAKQTHKPVAYKHEGEEFVYVMAGTVELTLGNRPHLLKTGESLNFNSEIPHKLKSIGNEETRCLVVLYTP